MLGNKDKTCISPLVISAVEDAQITSDDDLSQVRQSLHFSVT